MKFLLDTNVISELRKIGTSKVNPKVADWIAQHNAEDFFISVVSLMEIEQGLLSLQRRDKHQARLLRHWFEDIVIPEFAERTLPFEAVAALQCARLHVPNPRSERDAIIAATALVAGLCIVTRNTKDFEPMDVCFINPWEEG